MTGMLLTSDDRRSKAEDGGGSPLIDLSTEQRLDTFLCSSISSYTRDAKAKQQ
jgi:hypothetical protein